LGLHDASTPSAADDGPAGDACHAGSAVRTGFDEPLSDEHIAQVIALPQSTIAAWRLQRQQGFDLKMKLSTLRAPGCRCCAVSAAVCVAFEHGGAGYAGEGDAGGDVIWVRLARIGAGNLRRGSKSLGDA